MCGRSLKQRPWCGGIIDIDDYVQKGIKFTKRKLKKAFKSGLIDEDFIKEHLELFDIKTLYDKAIEMGFSLDMMKWIVEMIKQEK